MRSAFFGEFMGTMILILLGDGVVAGVLLKRSKAEGAGWMVITTGWAFAVLCGIFTANLCGSSDAHLNPAITIAMACKSGDFRKVAPYLLAQVLGAFCGAALVWIQYLPHWKATAEADPIRGVFCTSPAIRNRGANLVSEVIATAVLVLVAGAIGSNLVFSTGAPAWVGPYLVSCVGLSLGGTTGYAINPARDFGPRLAHFVLPISGKAGSDWAYAWIPILGPILGGVAAGLFLKAVGA
jgi:glycerol uptake facilitator protein